MFRGAACLLQESDGPGAHVGASIETDARD